MAAYPPGDFQEEYRPLDDGVILVSQTTSEHKLLPFFDIIAVDPKLRSNFERRNGETLSRNRRVCAKSEACFDDAPM